MMSVKTRASVLARPKVCKMLEARCGNVHILAHINDLCGCNYVPMFNLQQPAHISFKHAQN